MGQGKYLKVIKFRNKEAWIGDNFGLKGFERALYRIDYFHLVYMFQK